MNEIMKDLLLNILFLLFFLLFIPLILDQISISKHKKKWIKNSSYSIAIISCITFPIVINEEIIFDLRLVATIIGGLYGGIPLSILLWATNISYRALFGGSGVYSTVIIASTHLFFLVYIFPKFKILAKKYKIISSSILATLSALFVIVIIDIVFNTTIPLHISLAFVILQTVAVGIIVYIKELMKETLMLKDKIIQAEKMETVSHLASSISHEVRNPLTVVKGFLQLILQTDLAKDKRDEFLKLSINEIDRANSIIRDYLTFAKPAPEKVEILHVTSKLNKGSNFYIRLPLVERPITNEVAATIES